MFHQSGGWGQRPRGFRVKQALQFGLLLAVCVWLFYKLQHSNEKGSSYGGSAEKRNIEEFQTIDFGRKGMAGTNADVVKMFKDRNGVEVYEDLLESVVNGDGKNEEEMETQEGDSKRGGGIKDVNVEFPDTIEDTAEENVMNHDEEVDEKKLNKNGNEAMGADVGEKESEKVLDRREEDSEGNEIDTIQSQQTDGDERIDSNSDEGSVDKLQLQPSQREKPNAADTIETEEGVDSFQDVNGVPPEGLQLVKYSPNVDKADEPNANSDREPISSSDNETSHDENRTEYEDIDKSSQLDGGVDDEVQFSKKGTNSVNNEGSDSLQELISLSRPTERENEPSDTNSVDA